MLPKNIYADFKLWCLGGTRFLSIGVLIALELIKKAWTQLICRHMEKQGMLHFLNFLEMELLRI